MVEKEGKANVEHRESSCCFDHLNFSIGKLDWRLHHHIHMPSRMVIVVFLEISVLTPCIENVPEQS